MNKLILCGTLIFILVSCDSPQRTRTPYGTYTSTPVSSSVEDSATDTGDSASDDGTTTDNGSTTDTGFETCDLTQKYDHAYIGKFGICQSTLDDSKFKLKMTNTDSSEGTCFVPVRRNTDGTSFKLGIAECVHNEGAREYSVTLTKERSEKINGMFVLKARALTPYMQCMNAVQYFNSYTTNNLDQSCYYSSYGDANYYAQCVCTKFVSTYRNYYSDTVSFPLNN